MGDGMGCGFVEAMVDKCYGGAAVEPADCWAVPDQVGVGNFEGKTEKGVGNLLFCLVAGIENGGRKRGFNSHRSAGKAAKPGLLLNEANISILTINVELDGLEQ
jgi:hypothetical protein